MRRLAGTVTALVAAFAAAAPSALAGPDLARHVAPFVGTKSGAPDFGTGGGAGATFPGAVVPFGLVQFSPDTTPSTDNYAGGYSYDDDRLRGFSLTHFSGGGCASLQDVPILPTTVPVDEAPGVQGSGAINPRYVPHFDHRSESASPGAYGVTLDPGTDRAIGTELTATTRTGLARFHFPPTKTASVLFNSGGSAMANGDAQAAVDPARREVSGMSESGRFCYQQNAYRVYYVARFSRPFAAHGTWKDQELRPGGTEASDHSDSPYNYQPVPGGPGEVPGDPSGTAQAGAWATFDTTRRRTVQVRVGVSFTSVDEARRNLDAEARTGRFTAHRRAARRAWNRALGRIRVSGGSRRNLRLFYTSLYHALLHPNVFSDADGSYAGMDGRTQRAAGRTQYATFSGWDVYRGQQQLVAMLFPRRAADMAQTLVANAQESGCLPRWALANGQTSVMTGDPSDQVIASAYAFGARRFDARAALAAMLRGATETCHTANGDYTQREALDDYLRQGYIGHERNADVLRHNFDRTQPWGSAATTLEYASADFAISRLAAALGESDTAETFLARSANWRRLFNPAGGYIEPRYSGGAFKPGYDPASDDGFAEGSGAQYTWLVPHDPAGLFEAMGGRDAARGKLDHFFADLNAGPHSEHAFLGNEPTLGAPWLYAWLGQPWKTQEIVRRAMLELYAPEPGGMPGNDDGGTMSAWWVLGAVGLYPAVPGEDILGIGSPLFRRTTIGTGRGRVRIAAPGAGPRRPYVQSLSLGRRALEQPWIRFRRIARGARLRFALGRAANPAWGAAPASAPPSFAPPPAGDAGGPPIPELPVP